SVPPIHGRLRPRAGLLPLQPRADREPRAELERAAAKGVIGRQPFGLRSRIRLAFPIDRSTPPGTTVSTSAVIPISDLILWASSSAARVRVDSSAAAARTSTFTVMLSRR